jgi:hypothetical protein
VGRLKLTFGDVLQRDETVRLIVGEPKYTAKGEAWVRALRYKKFQAVPGRDWLR